MNVATRLTEQATQRPDAAALIDAHRGAARVVTFAELERDVAAVAGWMSAHGVRQGASVFVLLPPSVELYVALAAVLRAGGQVVVAEMSGGPAVWRAAVRDTGPVLAVCSVKAAWWRLTQATLRRIPFALASGWAPRATPIGAARRAHPCAIAPRGADDAALVTFTSGSTGAPKGVIRTHGILAAQLDALSGTTAAAGEVDCGNLPIVALANLARGATTVIPSYDYTRAADYDPMPVLDQCATHGVTRLTASPAFLSQLTSRPHPALSHITRVVTGGGPLFPDVLQHLHRALPHAVVTAVYGSTEAEPIAHRVVPRDDAAAADAAARGEGLLAGRPDPTVRCVVIPGDALPNAPMTPQEFAARAAASGVVGEVVVSGPHIVRHYVREEDERGTKLRVGDAIWHRTGDLARYDAEGRLWLLGRAGLGGTGTNALHPIAVEAAVRAVVRVRHAAALLHRGQRVLVVSPYAGEALDASEIRRALAWAALDAVRVWPTIPVDARHQYKVDYAKVREGIDAER
ncbi:MAG: AMP-binding protein [Gemmatimonadaceae bacterium]|nr:AMP-binding protein [Gemmatimonadaceae bacterium]